MRLFSKNKLDVIDTNWHTTSVYIYQRADEINVLYDNNGKPYNIKLEFDKGCRIEFEEKSIRIEFHNALQSVIISNFIVYDINLDLKSGEILLLLGINFRKNRKIIKKYLKHKRKPLNLLSG